MSAILERLTAALADRYRIERELGAGGMATVFLAEDIKHKRMVALKVLKPELAAVLGAERFVQEITTTAALQHPHILPLFDSGTADGFLFYVMPFIDGETLRGKLDRETQFGVDEAVKIATDVADALHHAHQHGVIHRDIKPENILLANGRPMVADFGIALAVSAAAGGRMTETGLSLGTPHYMSPEQATAEKEITARSDVYSLGSVLYEMLTGNPPHVGSSAQQIIMKIITEQAQTVTALRKSVPANVAAAVAKSLEKLPADRFESAAKFAEALANPGFTTARSQAEGTASSSVRGGSRRVVVALAAVAVLATSLAAWGWLRQDAERPAARLDLSLGGIVMGPSDVTVSADGSMLATAGTVGGELAIYLRRIGAADFHKVLGTEDGARPSFSPDNEWIVFRKFPENSLVKVRVSGGGAVTLVRGSEFVVFESHWGTDDLIAFSGPTGVFTVPAGGGTPTRWDAAGGRVPFLLPDGSGLLHTAGGDVSVLDFATDSSTLLIPQARHPVYVETGHLLYVAEDGGLFSVPFDLKRHRVTGAAVRVLDRVAASLQTRGFAVSRNGTLVHQEGASNLGGGGSNTRFVILDMAGRADTVRLPPGHRRAPRFSPSGRALAFEAVVPSRTGATDIYTFDLVNGTNTQITFEEDNDEPRWSPDGKRILFSRNLRGALENLYIKNADNSAAEELVLDMPGQQDAEGWIDDRTIYFSSDSANNSDLFTYSLTDKGAPRPYLQAPWDEFGLVVSPDRRLAAFTSDETGVVEVWLRTWPVAEGKWKISTGSASNGARWAPDGRYVYYWKRGSPIDTLFRARVDRTPAVVVRSPEPVAALNMLAGDNWDLHPDGTRFVVTVLEGAPQAAGVGGAESASRYLVVLNWFTELKALMAQGARP